MAGKFEGNANPELAERLHDLTLDGMTTDQFGSVDDIGWHGLIYGDNGMGYIVREDSQGFFDILMQAANRQDFDELRASLTDDPDKDDDA